jgi:threonine synthase
MKYYSTNNKNIKSSFKDSVIQGLAPDKGLFFPERIPQLRKEFLSNLSDYSLQDIGFEIASAFIEDEIPANDLRQIIKETLNFEIPLLEVEKDIYSLELFHGPTCAFKDVGARFMAQCLRYFTKGTKNKITILVATSGDTGSAVANGFYSIDGIDVIILYPASKVSELQEMQLTGMDKNITALKIDGTFDDCQNLVKSAFMDSDLKEKMNLSSANSINIARLLPQSFYYFHAISQLKDVKRPIIFSVPSGNYGNLTAGLLSKKMGLNINRYIASSNINKIVPDYLTTGKFVPKPSVETISNAMDVGNPSNFDRILALYDHNYENITKDIIGYYFTDKETRSTIKKVYNNTKYILDPHGAVAYLGVMEYLQKENAIGVFFETAHPGKFAETVQTEIDSIIVIPERLKKYMKKEKKFTELKTDYSTFKKYLIDTLSINYEL